MLFTLQEASAGREAFLVEVSSFCRIPTVRFSSPSIDRTPDMTG